MSAPTPMRARDYALERRTLDALGPLDPGGRFARLVLARLDDHANAAAFDATDPGALLAELGEEALDVAGWALLARQALDTLAPADAARVGADLDALTALGAEAFAIVTRALAACDRQRASGPA